MFTAAEKKYLAITLLFLAIGSGFKIYRRSQAKLGPFPDVTLLRADSLQTSLEPSFPVTEIMDSVNQAAVHQAAVQKVAPRHTVGHTQEFHSKAQFLGKVSVNHSEISELTQIKGIGEKTAQAIIEFRKQNGPFREIADLCLVKGIGEKKLEKITPFLIL